MKKLIPSLILIGVTSITAQIILLRELLVLFSGDELSIGIILANWLFWTTIGSWISGRLAKKIKRPALDLALSEIILSFFLAATILSTRGIRIFIRHVPGEIFGIVPIWLYSFVLLSGICVMNGFLFVIGCSSYEKLCKDADPAKSISKVYIFESLGAGFGGIICSILLIRYFNSVQIIWFLILTNLFCAGLLWARARLIISAVLAAILFLGFSGYINFLDIKSRMWQWKGYNFIESRDSIYGNITITGQNSVFSFYENSLLAFSTPDKLSSEETAHFALLQNSKAERVLLLGGGIGGVTEEILKYANVKSIDYVELDPLIIKMAGDILPLTILDNPKVHVYNIDGRRFLKTTPSLYDIIIVNMPDPNNAQINRFYTKEFFEDASAHLNLQGVLTIGATSSENYISPELGEYLRCIYYTLKSVFPDVKVIPGDYCRFIAGKGKGFITDDYNLLEKRLTVDTEYVRDYYLKDRLSHERLSYILEQLTKEKPKFINTDFHPICYYYNITLWSTYFNTLFKKIFHAAVNIKLWHFSGLFLIAFFFPRIKKRYGVLTAIMTSGFSEISFQVVTILAFQVIYGYVYYKLGIIITSFMIGLALGSFSINKVMPKIKNDYSVFIKTQIAIMIYPLLLPPVFYLFERFGGVFSAAGENIIFPYLPVVSGFIGGFQFPLGNKIYLAQKKEIGSTAGITYGIDLLGSCIGVLLISAFILPILGITQTCLVTAMVNLSSLVLLIKNQRDLSR